MKQKTAYLGLFSAVAIILGYVESLVPVFEGKVTGRFRTADVTREEIGYYLTGGRQDTKEAEAR